MAYIGASAPPMPQQQDTGPPPGYPQQQQHHSQPSYAPNTTSRPEQGAQPQANPVNIHISTTPQNTSQQPYQGYAPPMQGQPLYGYGYPQQPGYGQPPYPYAPGPSPGYYPPPQTGYGAPQNMYQALPQQQQQHSVLAPALLGAGAGLLGGVLLGEALEDRTGGGWGGGYGGGYGGGQDVTIINNDYADDDNYDGGFGDI
ncbi:hypothetical protein CVIRNUC_010453 [Coccomyxa viridis]|uniref:Uncharacterized protein n=1 Tax=Coccomyxa viridis TaxID=1274662 RepID=A0AAV1IKM7_9CHLO|nr:hypothetical protein CVIRNUC_010453 [Coccomyxa viridis]